MNLRRQWMGFLLLGWCVCAPLLAANENPDFLRWNVRADKVDAEIDAWPLSRLLENVTAATGWQVYIEPDTKRTISAKFKGLSSSEALKRLFGDLNYALLSQKNSRDKLYIFRTTLSEATQLVAKPGPKAVGNELILTLKPGANAEEIARRLGGKIVGRIDELGIIRLRFENDDAARLARDQLTNANDVAAVDANYYVEPPPDSERVALSSGLPFNLNPTVAPNGKGVVVGLIDTAVQTLDARYQAFLLQSISVAGEADVSRSSPTHGTSMAETILRALAMSGTSSESSVRVLPIDVYGNNAMTTTWDVAQGILEAIKNGANPINLSLGSSGNTQFLQTLIENTAKQGVLYFGAAGNEPVSTPTYPAAYPDVVAVTAGDKNGNIAAYANYGNFVDITAPGVSLVTYNNRTFVVSGTSAATAFATGTAAALQSNLSLTPQQVRERLINSWGVKK
ncbi:MAG: S8 family serine peptidase [Verrucomicrobiota bacterium]